MRRTNLFAGAAMFALLVAVIGCEETFIQTRTIARHDWRTSPDRVWVGPDFWANRLQDWRTADGRLECTEGGVGKPMRTVHLLTSRLENRPGDFYIELRTGLIGDRQVSPAAAAGLLLGAGPGLDYRAAALVHHSAGAGAGVFVGLDATGRLLVRDFAEQNAATRPLASGERAVGRPTDAILRITGHVSGADSVISAAVLDPETMKVLDVVACNDIAADRLAGGIAIVSDPGVAPTGRFWFNDLRLSGAKVGFYPRRNCGPILSAQYTVHQGLLKMTAQMMPLSEEDTQTVSLQVREGFDWKTVDTADVVAPGWTAAFRVENWDATRDAPYRIVYDLVGTDGSSRQYDWTGTVRHDPVEKDTIVVAGFTGNHNVRHPGVDRGAYTWNADWLWFPHNDIVNAIRRHDPDLLFFSGDNVYEGASPTVPDRSGDESSYYDYLYKWYLYCWAYRDLTRDIPSISIPDDHDVFQGNLWGAGGRATEKDDKGGYIMPADWVRMVERTQTSHLPDPYDPTPVEQGIGVYYTDLNVGRVSFAILEDRKFKSGPNGLVPPTTSGRADHVIDPDFDPATVDVPGATLLGERQLDFLHDWAADWTDTDMKATLSQTIFAGMATHHGPGLDYLVADLDSNGWPQTGRNKALSEIRKGFAFMVGGDQHLATIVHHGVDDWEDAGWSFCVPSIANFYPRQWAPAEPPAGKVNAPQPYTGRYLDGLGNHVTVWAHTNPRSMDHEPAALHDKMPGYGIVRFNKDKRTITMECWPRFADPADSAAKPYTGWPKTIDQVDNYGRRPYGFLPTIRVSGMTDPVIQVIDEKSSEIVYTLRIQGGTFTPKVFQDGTYTVRVGEPASGLVQTFTGIAPTRHGKVSGMLRADF